MSHTHVARTPVLLTYLPAICTLGLLAWLDALDGASTDVRFDSSHDVVDTCDFDGPACTQRVPAHALVSARGET